MRFTITPYDECGAPTPADVVDLATLKTVLAEAALSGRRLHIRPHPRQDHPPVTTPETP